MKNQHFKSLLSSTSLYFAVYSQLSTVDPIPVRKYVQTQQRNEQRNSLCSNCVRHSWKKVKTKSIRRKEETEEEESIWRTMDD